MSTSTIDSEVARRKRKKAAPEVVTMRDDFRDALLARIELATHVKFPSPRYRQDPEAFCREILGFTPWKKQIETMEAVRDHGRVAVRSGHKTGKSRGAAALALWYYCSYENARVTMTSTTARQVDQILWREVRMLLAKGAKCVACKEADPRDLTIARPCPHSSRVDGTLGDLARTGLKSTDFREIVGFTAREAEAVAGISGANLLYIVDEASGVASEIFEAIEGNRAGGARILLLGNPTNNDGEFYEAFHAKRDLYYLITVSSEDTPNVIEGRDVVPGLATRSWVEEKKEEWGEESSQYKIRVKGIHALHEDGKVFSIHSIVQAEQRWHGGADTGRLFIGVDPAGETGTGDDSCFAIRRGLKILKLVHMSGLSADAHVVHLVAMLNDHSLKRETPVVVLDALGDVGTKVRKAMREYLEKNPGAFELVALRSSDNAVRKPGIYHKIRDELAANLESWFRDGGAIVEDAKLAAELHVLEWRMHINGRLKVTAKDDIRKKLGRSPDRYDAIALSVWEPLSLQAEADLPSSVKDMVKQDDQSNTGMDPYSGADAWKPRGQLKSLRSQTSESTAWKKRERSHLRLVKSSASDSCRPALKEAARAA